MADQKCSLTDEIGVPIILEVDENKKPILVKSPTFHFPIADANIRKKWPHIRLAELGDYHKKLNTLELLLCRRAYDMGKVEEDSYEGQMRLAWRELERKTVDWAWELTAIRNRALQFEPSKK
ncbi:MAG: hypothetical protein Q9212_002357 [Teloschistes hypoglaucus]